MGSLAAEIFTHEANLLAEVLRMHHDQRDSAGLALHICIWRWGDYA
jgi:hypothetical protein